MPQEPARRIRLGDLPAKRETAFSLTPDAAERAEIARELGVDGVRKLRFSGTLTPEGRRDWRLQAELGATVVQPCVVTLDPVTTRIDETVTRRYLAEWETPAGDEVEMPEDDTIDPLPDVLDLRDVMVEALALALPAFPRKDDAEPGDAVFTEPGKTALTDEAAKPFAGLRDLKDRLSGSGDD